jgi:hypothetical protein
VLADGAPRFGRANSAGSEGPWTLLGEESAAALTSDARPFWLTANANGIAMGAAPRYT